MRGCLCLSELTFAFSLTFFSAFYFWTIYSAAKVPKGTNRNLPARNTLVQLLAMYTDPESHNAWCHRQTGWRTDRWHDVNVQQYEQRLKSITIHYSTVWITISQNKLNQMDSIRFDTSTLCHTLVTCGVSFSAPSVPRPMVNVAPSISKIFLCTCTASQF